MILAAIGYGFLDCILDFNSPKMGIELRSINTINQWHYYEFWQCFGKNHVIYVIYGGMDGMRHVFFSYQGSNQLRLLYPLVNKHSYWIEHGHLFCWFTHENTGDFPWFAMIYATLPRISQVRSVWYDLYHWCWSLVARRCKWQRQWNSISGWWLGHPSEKYESQLGRLFPIYGKIKNGNQTTNQ